MTSTTSEEHRIASPIGKPLTSLIKVSDVSYYIENMLTLEVKIKKERQKLFQP